MAAKRKSLSQKIRYEVFKRDGFKCQYCGRSVPEVTLEVDHIVPVAEGGENDMMNLITSCRDCNRGKGKIPLDDETILKKQKAELEGWIKGSQAKLSNEKFVAKAPEAVVQAAREHLQELEGKLQRTLELINALQ